MSDVERLAAVSKDCGVARQSIGQQKKEIEIKDEEELRQNVRSNDQAGDFCDSAEEKGPEWIEIVRLR